MKEQIAFARSLKPGDVIRIVRTGEEAEFICREFGNRPRHLCYIFVSVLVTRERRRLLPEEIEPNGQKT